MVEDARSNDEKVGEPFTARVRLGSISQASMPCGSRVSAVAAPVTVSSR
jgi:hypothetical protein